MEDAADDDNDDIIEVNPNATNNKENEDDDDNIQEIDDWGKCHFYHKLEVFLNLPLDCTWCISGLLNVSVFTLSAII